MNKLRLLLTITILAVLISACTTLEEQPQEVWPTAPITPTATADIPAAPTAQAVPPTATAIPFTFVYEIDYMWGGGGTGTYGGIQSGEVFSPWCKEVTGIRISGSNPTGEYHIVGMVRAEFAELQADRWVTVVKEFPLDAVISHGHMMPSIPVPINIQGLPAPQTIQDNTINWSVRVDLISFTPR